MPDDHVTTMVVCHRHHPVALCDFGRFVFDTQAEDPTFYENYHNYFGMDCGWLLHQQPPVLSCERRVTVVSVAKLAIYAVCLPRSLSDADKTQQSVSCSSTWIGLLFLQVLVSQHVFHIERIFWYGDRSC